MTAEMVSEIKKPITLMVDEEEKAILFDALRDHVCCTRDMDREEDARDLLHRLFPDAEERLASKFQEAEREHKCTMSFLFPTV